MSTLVCTLCVCVCVNPRLYSVCVCVCVGGGGGGGGAAEGRVLCWRALKRNKDGRAFTTQKLKCSRGFNASAFTFVVDVWIWNRNSETLNAVLQCMFYSVHYRPLNG